MIHTRRKHIPRYRLLMDYEELDILVWLLERYFPSPVARIPLLNRAENDGLRLKLHKYTSFYTKHTYADTQWYWTERNRESDKKLARYRALQSAKDNWKGP